MFIYVQYTHNDLCAKLKLPSDLVRKLTKFVETFVVCLLKIQPKVKCTQNDEYHGNLTNFQFRIFFYFFIFICEFD